MDFSSQEYWSGLPFPSPGDLPDPGIGPGSPALGVDALLSEPPGNQSLQWEACAFQQRVAPARHNYRKPTQSNEEKQTDQQKDNMVFMKNNYRPIEYNERLDMSDYWRDLI